MCVRVCGCSALRSFRLLRVLRSLKVLRRNANLRRLFKLVLEGFLALRDFMLLLGLFLFIFAILGMQMFGGKEEFGRGATPLYRKNFDSLWEALLTVFELLTGANWLYLMWQVTSMNCALHALTELPASSIRPLYTDCIADVAKIKGAGHTVAQYQPMAGFEAFSRWLLRGNLARPF